MTRLSLSLIAVVMMACGSLAAPQTPTIVYATPPPPVWILGGQSNAVGLHDPLTDYAPIYGTWKNTQPIAAWDEGQPLWQALSDALRIPHTAFIWWQGESDVADLFAYHIKLEGFIDRVRAIQGTSMPVVIISANGSHQYDALRTLQQAYATSHPATRYVATADLPMPLPGDYDVPTQTFLPLTLPASWQSPHLTLTGYKQAAARIWQVLQ